MIEPRRVVQKLYVITNNRRLLLVRELHSITPG
jgi:hypothetical protein